MTTMMTRHLVLLLLTLLVTTLAQNVHPDIVVVLNVTGGVRPGGESWADSYSVGNQCYCKTTFDHNIGNYYVETPLGWLTTRQICELLGEGPGNTNRPVYNDLACGNGPPNDAGDEHVCPGRVDIGRNGCGHIGPNWNFDSLMNDTVPPPTISVPPDAHPDIVAVINVTGGVVHNMTMASSFSVGGECYCTAAALNDSIGDFYVNTLLGWKTVRDVCNLLGPGPVSDEQAIYYNDVQCGNGPPSATGDEHDCPGRIDIGEEGCGHIGPRWNLEPFLALQSSSPSMAQSILSTSFPSEAPTILLPAAPPTTLPPTMLPVTSSGINHDSLPLIVQIVTIALVVVLL